MFRNRLIRLTLVTVIALGLMLFAFAANAIPLTFTFVGNQQQSYIEIALVVSLFGALGAVISSVPSLARTSGTWNPFNLPLYQMVVKVALGPLFALIGMILLESGVISNIQAPKSLSDLLVWALAFGIAQQAVTRVIDTRVAGLVSIDPTECPTCGRRGRSGTSRADARM